MTEVTLSVKNLHKTIGRKEIIKGLNFELKKAKYLASSDQMVLVKQRRFEC